MAGPDALSVAVAIYREPAQAADWRHRQLPEDVELLLRVACGEREALSEARSRMGMTESDLAEAAVLALQQLLFNSGGDAYRVLGAGANASHDQLRRHYRWLMKWLHPDRDGDGWESVYADRVNLAWQALKTPERRARHDADSGIDAGSFRPVPRGDEPPQPLLEDRVEAGLARVRERARNRPVADPREAPRPTLPVLRPRLLLSLLAAAGLGVVGLVYLIQPQAPSVVRPSWDADEVMAQQQATVTSRATEGRTTDPRPNAPSAAEPVTAAPIAVDPLSQSRTADAPELPSADSDAAAQVDPSGPSNAAPQGPSVPDPVETTLAVAASTLPQPDPATVRAAPTPVAPLTTSVTRKLPAVSAPLRPAPAIAAAAPVRPPVVQTVAATTLPAPRSIRPEPAKQPVALQTASETLPAPPTPERTESRPVASVPVSVAAPDRSDRSVAAPPSEPKASLPLPQPKVDSDAATMLVKAFAAAYSAGNASQFDELFANDLGGGAFEQMRERLSRASMRYLEVGDMEWQEGEASLHVMAPVRDTFVPAGERKAVTRVGQMRWEFRIVDGAAKIAAVEFLGR